jgi:hypothetical protein
MWERANVRAFSLNSISATKKMMDLDMAPPLLRGLTVTRQGLVDTSFVDDLYVTFHLALCTIQI